MSVTLTQSTQEQAAPLPVVENANASRRGLARNTLFGYLSTFIGMASGFLVTPFLVHHLGTTSYGLWVLLGTVAGYIGLVEIGVSTAIAKRVAECLALSDRERLERVLGTAFVMYVGFAQIALIFTGVLMLYIGRWFHVPAGSLGEARACLLLLGLGQALNFLFTSQTAILFGAGRQDLGIGYTTILSLFVAVASVLLVIYGWGIIALAWLFFANALASGVFGAWVIRKHLPHIRIRPNAATWDTMRELAKYGSRNAVLSVAGTVAYGLDAPIIALLLPISSVGVYVIASRLTNIIASLSTRPLDLTLPSFVHFHAEGNKERQVSLFTQSVTLSMMVCLPFVISLFIFGNALLTAWVGPGHAASAAVAAGLALMIFLMRPGHASSVIMTGTENNVWLVRMYLFAALFNLSLSYGLTRSLGVMGVVYGSLCTVSLVDLFILPAMVCRQIGVKYGDFLKQSLLPLLAPACAGTVLAFFMLKLFAAPFLLLHLPSAKITAALMLVIVIAGCWIAWLFTGISGPQRRQYLHLIRAKLIKRRS